MFKIIPKIIAHTDNLLEEAIKTLDEASNLSVSQGEPSNFLVFLESMTPANNFNASLGESEATFHFKFG